MRFNKPVTPEIDAAGLLEKRMEWARLQAIADEARAKAKEAADEAQEAYMAFERYAAFGELSMNVQQGLEAETQIERQYGQSTSLYEQKIAHLGLGGARIGGAMSNSTKE